MILDFVDSKDKVLFWRGAARGLGPAAPTKKVGEAVRSIIENYPPRMQAAANQ